MISLRMSKKKTYRPIDILNVYYQSETSRTIVGRLAYKNGQIWFEYDANFLATGLELSPIKLPLQRGVISGKDSPFEGLFGLFNDSLPDGWGRLLLDRYMVSLGIDHVSLSPLDRLAYVGNNGMGALCYEPDYSEVHIKNSDLDLNKLNNEVNKVIEGESTETLEELYNLGGSSAGARPKVLIGYNPKTNRIIHGQQELPEGFEHWMVKFASSLAQKDIGRIEYAYSIMAKQAGIEMPETKLFQGEGQNQWFGIKRFDRKESNRIHMHSASGLLHADHRYPSLDYDGLFRCALILNQDIQEVTKLFRLATFNIFAHNRDDHSKNFSFLMD
ncbi:MAG: type II toxin-antitoxin system HipA family toxin, partial [Marinilabiliales bacterium]